MPPGLLMLLFRGLYLLFKEQHLRDRSLFQFIMQHPAFSFSIVLNLLFAVLLVLMTDFANITKRTVVDRDKGIAELKLKLENISPSVEQLETAEKLHRLQSIVPVLQNNNQSLNDENMRLKKENMDLRSQRPTTKPPSSRRRQSPDNDSSQVNEKLKKLDYLRSL